MPGLFDSPQQGGGLLGAGGNIGAGLNSFAHSDALLPAIANMISGFATGQRADPQGMALQQQQATYDALIKSIGDALPPDKAHAIATAAALNPKEFGQFAAPYLDTAPKVQFVPNSFGGNTAYIVRSGAHPGVQQAPIEQPGGGVASGVAPEMPDLLTRIDQAKQQGATREQLLQMIPPETGLRNVVGAALSGSAIPTQYSMKGKQRDNMLTLGHAIDENMNEQELHARQKIYTDLNSNSPTSLGGAINRGGTAFKHLANLADYFSQLNNNPGYSGLGGTLAGTAINALTNNALVRSPEQSRKIAQANDQGLKYGQESTAYITQGRGGTVEERTNTLKANNAVTSLPQEQAGYLIAERKALLDKTEEYENQIRTGVGEGQLAKRPIRTQEFKDNLKKLDAAIIKLDPKGAAEAGIDVPATPAAAQPQAAPVGAPQPGTVMKGYRFKGGNPADQNSWEKVQ